MIVTTVRCCRRSSRQRRWRGKEVMNEWLWLWAVVVECNRQTNTTNTTTDHWPQWRRRTGLYLYIFNAMRCKLYAQQFTSPTMEVAVACRGRASTWGCKRRLTFRSPRTEQSAPTNNATAQQPQSSLLIDNRALRYAGIRTTRYILYCRVRHVFLFGTTVRVSEVCVGSSLSIYRFYPFRVQRNFIFTRRRVLRSDTYWRIQQHWVVSLFLSRGL